MNRQTPNYSLLATALSTILVKGVIKVPLPSPEKGGYWINCFIYAASNSLPVWSFQSGHKVSWRLGKCAWFPGTESVFTCVFFWLQATPRVHESTLGTQPLKEKGKKKKKAILTNCPDSSCSLGSARLSPLFFRWFKLWENLMIMRWRGIDPGSWEALLICLWSYLHVAWVSKCHKPS